jgi:hypothetical protein
MSRQCVDCRQILFLSVATGAIALLSSCDCRVSKSSNSIESANSDGTTRHQNIRPKKSKADVQNQTTERKFGLERDDAPHPELFEWIGQGSNFRESHALKEGMAAKIIEGEGTTDCIGLKLNSQLRSTLESKAELRWLRVSLSSNEDVKWLSTLSTLRGLSINADLPGTVFYLKPLQTLKNLEWLEISIRQGEIGNLPHLESLELLSFSHPRFNGRFAEGLGYLPNLRVLVAQHSELDNAGYRALPKMCPNIEVLNLYRSAPISMDDVGELIRLQRLYSLDIGLTKIELPSLDRLRKAFPDLEISTLD